MTEEQERALALLSHRCYLWSDRVMCSDGNCPCVAGAGADQIIDLSNQYFTIADVVDAIEKHREVNGL